MSTLSIVDLIKYWNDTYQVKLYDPWGERRWIARDLWPLSAGLWSVPITFGLLIAMIRCQMLQQREKDISKTITVIKAMVSFVRVYHRRSIVYLKCRARPRVQERLFHHGLYARTCKNMTV